MRSACLTWTDPLLQRLNRLGLVRAMPRPRPLSAWWLSRERKTKWVFVRRKREFILRRIRIQMYGHGSLNCRRKLFCKCGLPNQSWILITTCLGENWNSILSNLFSVVDCGHWGRSLNKLGPFGKPGLLEIGRITFFWEFTFYVIIYSKVRNNQSSTKRIYLELTRRERLWIAYSCKSSELYSQTLANWHHFAGNVTHKPFFYAHMRASLLSKVFSNYSKIKL